ncbi:MAG: hypothetical protein QM535_19800 [Limnohabitans sp.]|nr:hypothetical protein [Limnohabitans sp.]
MKKHISTGTYAIPKSNESGSSLQLALAYGFSYSPEHTENKIIVNFHKNSKIFKEDDYHILELTIDEAKTFSDVLKNITIRLDEKISLSKKELLKDECYEYDNENENETF